MFNRYVCPGLLPTLLTTKWRWGEEKWRTYMLIYSSTYEHLIICCCTPKTKPLYHQTSRAAEPRSTQNAKCSFCFSFILILLIKQALYHNLNAHWVVVRLFHSIHHKGHASFDLKRIEEEREKKRKGQGENDREGEKQLKIEMRSKQSNNSQAIFIAINSNFSNRSIQNTNPTSYQMIDEFA